MYTKMSLFTLVVVFFSAPIFAEEVKNWKNESEASIVQVGGNTTSESYSAKSKTSYQLESNVITGMGRYLQTRAGGTETAKQWEASVRLEREFGQSWSVFVQQGAESDVFAGYLQRDNTDLGTKYNFFKTESDALLAEAGFRSTKTLAAKTLDVSYENFGRLYVEYSSQLNTSVSAKAWVEYLPNFTNSDAYLLNYEPSFSVMMNQIFSIKLAYLVKYQNKRLPTEKKEDTSFTTALVAKF